MSTETTFSAEMNDTHASMPWYAVWRKAITQPATATYEQLIEDPKASFGRGALWLFLTALGGTLVALIVIGLLLGGGEGAGFIGVFTLVAALVAGVGLVIIIAINAGLTQLAARMLGGEGTFSHLYYGMAAYTAPLTLISSILGVIPGLNFVSPLLGIYALYLNVVAVRAVNRLGWGRAVAALLIPLVVLGIVAAVVVTALLLILGPVVNETFQNLPVQ